MDNFRLNDVEAIRVMRAGGNLRVRGVTSGDTLLQCDSEPQIRRVENRAEILIPGNATLEVSPGVAFEILECAGNLDIEDITAPLSLGRVRGNLRTRRVGSIVIRGEVAGNLSLEDAHALEGEQVNGNLRVEGARSIKFRTVAGNAECGTIEGEVSFEEVRGRLRVSVAGPVERASRGGQAAKCRGSRRSRPTTSATRSRRSRWRATSHSEKLAGGSVAMTLREAFRPKRSAATSDCAPFAARSRCRRSAARSICSARCPRRASGRSSAAAESASRCRRKPRRSLPRSRATAGCASTAFPRATLRVPRATWSRAHSARAGSISAWRRPTPTSSCSPAMSMRATMTAAAAPANFVSAIALARPSKTSRKLLRMTCAQEIPEFVGEILGAAGRIVSESGKFTGTIAHDVTRSVGEALREVERTISDLDDKVPHEVSDKLTRLGRKISDAVERAVDEARERRRDRRRNRDEASSEAGASTASSASSDEPPTPGSEGTRDAAMMKILNAVREGTLKPEEADRLIAAWAELHRGSSDSRAE